MSHSPPPPRHRATTMLAGGGAVIAFATVLLCGTAAEPLLSLGMLGWNLAPLALLAWMARRFIATPAAYRLTVATLAIVVLVEAAFLAATVAQVLVQFHGWTIPGVRPESLYGLVALLIPLPVGGIGLVGFAAALLVQRRERARISAAR
ncbi:MAG: hypothetical protein Q8S29_17195 [Phreatobacter sp.]|nr:hypothetical protein [Phreatobacter sp.]